jgi:putative hydrolases of HD superfamily
MAMMTLLVPPSLKPRLDLFKCTQMALFHDLGESLVGDLTPMDNVPKAEKNRRETESIDFIAKHLLGNAFNGPSDAGENLRAIWNEFEESKTLESLYVQDIDKIELLLQMMEYEKRANGTKNLMEFTYVESKVVLPEMQAIAAEIIKEREKFWAERRLTDSEAGRVNVTAEHQKMLDQYYGKSTGKT